MRATSPVAHGHIGFVFQIFNLIPVLTAPENVELPLLLTPLAGERREHVADALALVGLDDRDRPLPRQLSGGQEQRVAIARAIVTDPTASRRRAHRRPRRHAPPRKCSPC